MKRMPPPTPSKNLGPVRLICCFDFVTQDLCIMPVYDKRSPDDHISNQVLKTVGQSWRKKFTNVKTSEMSPRTKRSMSTLTVIVKVNDRINLTTLCHGAKEVSDSILIICRPGHVRLESE